MSPELRNDVDPREARHPDQPETVTLTRDDGVPVTIPIDPDGTVRIPPGHYRLPDAWPDRPIRLVRPADPARTITRTAPAPPSGPTPDGMTWNPAYSAWQRGKIRIFPGSNGHSISCDDTWLPGLYDTVETARAALEHEDDELAALSNRVCAVVGEDRPITMTDLATLKARQG